MWMMRQNISFNFFAAFSNDLLTGRSLIHHIAAPINNSDLIFIGKKAVKG